MERHFKRSINELSVIVQFLQEAVEHFDLDAGTSFTLNMAWIKNAIIDLGITVVIAVLAFTGVSWAWWIVAIYTPLMVLLKVFGLSTAAAAVQQKASDVPTWFYHVLYGSNLILLLVAVFYWAAAGWAVIWVLSVVAESKRRPSKKSS
jgi:hypothetical protein